MGDWIKGAIKNPGALTRTAKRKGLVKKGETLTKADLDALKKSPDKKTRQRANLALLLRSFHKRK